MGEKLQEILLWAVQKRQYYSIGEIKQISLEQQVTLRYSVEAKRKKRETEWFSNQYDLHRVWQVDGMFRVDIYGAEKNYNKIK
jgi:hypothetical protein